MTLSRGRRVAKLLEPISIKLAAAFAGSGEHPRTVRSSKSRNAATQAYEETVSSLER